MANKPFINPTREQFKQLMAIGADYKGPIAMYNLLKLKKEGGKEAYARYIEGIQATVEAVDAHISNHGEALMTLIGDESWDELFVAEYPSIDAFIELQRDKVYQAAVPHRDAAVEDSRLICVKLESGKSGF